MESQENKELTSNIVKVEKGKIDIPNSFFTNDLATGLKLVGWVYFLFSLIGGVALWINSSESHYIPGGLYRSGEYIKTINYAYLSIGMVGAFSSLIVLLICLGIARTLEQNSKLLKILVNESSVNILTKYTICPNCNKELRLDNDDLLNKRYKCPVCLAHVSLTIDPV